MKYAVVVVVLVLAGCGGSVKTGGRLNVSSRPQLHPTTEASPTVGELFSTTNGTWGNSPTSFGYQWQDCNATGTSCAAATGTPLTLSTYTVVTGDVGKYIRVQVTATNSSGSAAAFSLLTGVVASGGGSNNGASLATCSSPNPCTATTAGVVAANTTTVSLPSTSNDDGSSSTRAFTVYRPAGLTNSAGNKAPAMLVMSHNGGVSHTGRWNYLAPTNKFLVVGMETLAGQWRQKWATCTGSSGCTPDDEPYIRAVIAKLTACPGQCADPARIYISGISQGGSMAGDTMCDPITAPLLRGVFLDSGTPSLTPSGAPDCPSTDKSIFLYLVLGNGGADQGAYCNTVPNIHLDIDGGLHGCPSHTVLPAQDHFANWAATHLGCTGSVTHDLLGTPTGGQSQADRYRFVVGGGNSCANITGGSAAEAIGAVGGFHQWFCQDSDGSAVAQFTSLQASDVCTSTPTTDGLYVEQEFWNFISAGTL